MSKHETPMTEWYWRTHNDGKGLLIREFPAVKGGKGRAEGKRHIDGVIICGKKSGNRKGRKGDRAKVKGKKVIVIQSKAKRLGMYLIGQTIVSRELMKILGAKVVLILAGLPTPTGDRPQTTFAQSVLELHRQWGKQSPGKQPDLSECWRRLAVGMVVEFDEQAGLRLLQANHCLVHVPAGKTTARAEIFGAELAAAFAEFEASAQQKPYRVPLAEF